MYYYFYKITNLINNKYYYGVHSTNNLNDNYMGSGVILKKAIKKYGASFFKKEILSFFSSKEEMFEYEKNIVNQQLLKDPLNYNLALGGNCGNLKCIQEIKHDKKTAEEIKISREQGIKKAVATKKKSGLFDNWSKNWKGYNNPEFVVLCKDKYEKDMDDIINFAKYTDIPDSNIEELFNKNVHLGKVFKYYEFLGKLKPKNTITQYRWLVYNHKVKTIYYDEKPLIKIAILRKNEKSTIKFKSVFDRLKTLPEILKYLQDDICSLSNVTNFNKYNFSIKDIDFFKRLGVLTNEKITYINTKGPDNHLHRGIRPVYTVNLNNSNYYIIDLEFNNYEFDNSGSLVQKGKFRLQKDGSVRIL